MLMSTLLSRTAINIRLINMPTEKRTFSYIFMIYPSLEMFIYRYHQVCLLKYFSYKSFIFTLLI